MSDIVINAATIRLEEALIPLIVFALICAALTERRYSRTITAAACGALALGGAALQAALWGRGVDLVLTLLPVIAYLPVILAEHLLSKNRFFPTCCAWFIASLAVYTLVFLRKFTATSVLWSGQLLYGPYFALWPSAVVGAALVFITCRCLRAPFLRCARLPSARWPALACAGLAALTLLAWLAGSAGYPAQELALFLTLLVLYLLLCTLAAQYDGRRRSAEAARAAEALLDAQRRDYAAAREKLDLGRAYRHDMRHHLTALNALLRQGEEEKARIYIDSLTGQLGSIEAERWCRNAAVNAVLAAHAARARAAGIGMSADVGLPEEMPFDDLDLCVVFSNTLENAVTACAALPEGLERRVDVSARLDGNRLAVMVANTFDGNASFDGEGFPRSDGGEGHGLGLRSVAAAAEKYNGAFRCGAEDGVFTVEAVLFGQTGDGAPPAAKKRDPSRLGAAMFGLLTVILLLNAMPATAQALEEVPVVGDAVRIVSLRTYRALWGSSEVRADVLGANGDEFPKLGGAVADYNALLWRKFEWYAARKYDGYVSLSGEFSDLEVLRDDGALYAARLAATLNIGGSMDFVRYLVLDKASGEVLSLSDLFAPGADYVTPISAEILRQMREREDAGEGGYFLDADFWGDDAFTAIHPDQQFYIGADGALVIVFDEYEAASGNLGMPQFAIPTELLRDILARPSLLG